ncbi:Zinc finger protein ZAT5 [Acorus calamus]|uniref:Zinc finger protein ZAT5 n=1 Tax=Acorus calamus TaxID=4465 RepID=A0AAV9DC98_ACOCL|nr:Zinc finger protein ZAT5 [Acorus calamus]
MLKRFRDAQEVELESVSMAEALILLARGGGGGVAAAAEGKVFECKTCNRQFQSFQALGGHRASHKKPRLAADGNGPAHGPTKPRVHECSVCGLEFAIGQALGGHMRRHRVAGGHTEEEGKVGGGGGKRTALFFDLNRTPAENDVMLMGHGLSETMPLICWV